MQVLDPTTGQIVTVPDAAQGLPYQTGRATQVSNSLLSQVPTFQGQEQGAVAGENQLVSNLNGVIAGTAPSVAQTQLAQGAGQIQQQAASQAGSVGGPNSTLAAYLGQIQSSMARAKANQDAAALRAQEVNQARQTQGQVLGNVANQGLAGYGTTLQGAGQFGGQAVSGAGSNASIQQQKDASNKAFIANLINGLGSAGATAATR